MTRGWMIGLLALQMVGATRGDSMSALVVGQVVDGDSRRPVAGAVVGLSGPPGAWGPHPRVLTGNDGRFFFRGLRRGTYNIAAFKPGYVEGAFGRTRPAGRSVPFTLADGERTGDAIIRLWKQASISGTVVDESGERLVGVRVQAYRRAVIAGQRRYVPAGAGSTDDRGIYRIGGLTPGDYAVGAVTRQGRGAPAPPPPMDGRLTTYPPTFHPQAPSGDSASIVSVRAGEEYLSADLQISPVPTVRVSGRVVGPDGLVAMTRLSLVAANTSEVALEADALSTSTDRGGLFTFPAVPSGFYTLRLRRGGSPQAQRLTPDFNTVLWTDLPLSVGIEHIEDLAVEAQPGIRIGGRVEFEGTGRAGSRGPVRIAIEQADPGTGGAGTVVTARADQYGEFRSPPLPGGRYYVRVPDSPAGWMFKSATLDGRDVTDTPAALSADTPNVVVTFTDQWSGISGSVRNRQGADADAAVIVFPTDPGAWASSGRYPRRVRLIRPGRLGEYSLNLPSGEYYVVAVPDELSADWQDPAFLNEVSRDAERIAIRDGERKVQDLRTRASR